MNTWSISQSIWEFHFIFKEGEGWAGLFACVLMPVGPTARFVRAS
jgi:hypothetical protein